MASFIKMEDGLRQNSLHWERVQPSISTFRVFSRICPERPKDFAAAVSLQGSETVLVVEDQEAVRELACIILESYGYRVLRATNGPEAIALAARYPAVIHLLMTDIILPVMDGRVLADELRAVRPEIKVLYVSGCTRRKRSGASEHSKEIRLTCPNHFRPRVLAPQTTGSIDWR